MHDGLNIVHSLIKGGFVNPFFMTPRKKLTGKSYLVESAFSESLFKKYLN